MFAWVGRHNITTKIFSNTGHRLFNATAGSTAVFIDKDGTPIAATILPKFLGDEVQVAEGKNFRLFRNRSAH